MVTLSIMYPHTYWVHMLGKLLMYTEEVCAADRRLTIPMIPALAEFTD